VTPYLNIESAGPIRILRLTSNGDDNRLTRACVLAICAAIHELRKQQLPVIIAGNPRFFSVGADLNEVSQLSGPDALEFAHLGQSLMQSLEKFPATMIAAIEGHCMGGGLDLVLACHRRIAAPNAVFGHRGAALGLITGWGGTQRLPRLIGKGRALELFVAAQTITAVRALEIGLVEAIADDPVTEAIAMVYASPARLNAGRIPPGQRPSDVVLS